MGRVFSLSLVLLVGLGAGVLGYIYGTPNSKFLQLHYLDTQSSSTEDSNLPMLPFFEVMSPVPAVESGNWVPSLNYRKGPPKRYLSSIKYSVLNAKNFPVEEVEFYGRRTQSSANYHWLSWVLDQQVPSYAQFILASLETAATGKSRYDPPGWKKPLARLLYRLEARKLATNYSIDVFVQIRAQEPAFLFYPKHRQSIGEEAWAWFFRRNALYEIRYSSKAAFAQLKPKELFELSFLSSNRKEALGFVGSQLASIKLSKENIHKLTEAELAWPLLLLGAKLSIDPASIHSFFHFSGLNALLYRHYSRMEGVNLNMLDAFRNNVLVADRYGKDVAPKSKQSAEMGRLARAITSVFQ